MPRGLKRRENTLSPSLSLLSDPAHPTQKLLFASADPTGYPDDSRASP